MTILNDIVYIIIWQYKYIDGRFDAMDYIIANRDTRMHL